MSFIANDVVQKFLDELSILIENTLPSKVSRSNLRYQHFFSGAAAYVDGKIFCTNTPKGIAVKIPAEERDKLISSKRGSELRYFPKAPIKKDYVVLTNKIVENPKELHRWILLALHYVQKGK